MASGARRDRALRADGDARRMLAEELDRTFFVEAGAGAGKTSALVERVVALVESGVPVCGIAAITFTDAAAAELRDRVRSRLETEAASGSAFALAALDDLDDAPLTTLHGFAYRILSAHAVDAALPAVIEVLDDVSSAIAFQREWAARFDALASDEANASTLGAAMVLGIEERHLRALAWAFHDHWDRIVGMPFAPSGIGDGHAHGHGHGRRIAVDTSELCERLAAVTSAVAGCALGGDRLRRHLEDTALRLAARLMDAGDDRLAVLDALAGSPDLRAGNRGVAANWRSPSKAEVVALLDAAEGARRSVLAAARVELLSLLAEEVRRFTLGRVERRRRAGRLEFHDLLVLTRDLLRANPVVLGMVRGDVSHVLIDEFQDTDPLQVELVRLLAAGDPGRLFFVGDPKQSIYRFRHADIAAYERVRRELRGSVVPLVANFRSTPAVIEWVNEVFRRLFSSPGQPSWHALVATRPGRSDAGPAVVTFGGAAPAGETVGSIREREGEDIVELVRRVVGDPWLVSAVDADADADRRTDRPADGRADVGDRWRPARLDDIAILLPTRTALPAIERALDRAGIASRIESRSLVWSTQEARDLLAVLRAIDDPSDQVAVVAALRTPALACSDRDLVDAVAAGLRWSAVASPETVAGVLPAGSPVRVALERLESFRADRWAMSFTALIERVVRELRFLELALAGRRHREAWNRIRFVVDQARGFADRGDGATLRSFVDWADRQADEKARAMETVVPEPDHRAVRITTVHAAKGREFPIVVVAGLSIEGEPYREAAVVWGDGLPALRLGRGDLGWCTSTWDDARSIDDALDRQEEDRLLYVACTRARDHLCVSLHHRATAGSRTSMGARLAAVARAPGPARRSIDLAAVAPVLPLGPPVVDVTDEPVEEAIDLPRWRDERQRVLDAAARPTSMSWNGRARADTQPVDAIAEGIVLGRDLHAGALIGDVVVEGTVDLVYESDDGLVAVVVDSGAHGHGDGGTTYGEHEPGDVDRLAMCALALGKALPDRKVVRARLIGDTGAEVALEGDALHDAVAALERAVCGEEAPTMAP